MTVNLSINNPKQLLFKLRMLVAGDSKFSLIYRLVILKDQIKSILNKKDPRESLIRKDTEIVIDGFQGSANSFATASFRNSQTKPVKMAHHLHSPVLIIEATKRNIPVILFVREPVGAILSLTSRWPYISVSNGLKSYINFYSKLEPFAGKYVVSNFEQTTQHFDLIVQNVNCQFSTDFDLIDTAVAERKHKPSQTRRKQLKQQKQQEFEWDINQDLLKKARAIYQKFESLSQQNY